MLVCPRKSASCHGTSKTSSLSATLSWSSASSLHSASYCLPRHQRHLQRLFPHLQLTSTHGDHTECCFLLCSLPLRYVQALCLHLIVLPVKSYLGSEAPDKWRFQHFRDEHLTSATAFCAYAAIFITLVDATGYRFFCLLSFSSSSFFSVSW